jgi:hypothetical protein
MRPDIEKRLHRVMIKASNEFTIHCDYALKCDHAQNCERCNTFHYKCSYFKNSVIDPK